MLVVQRSLFIFIINHQYEVLQLETILWYIHTAFPDGLSLVEKLGQSQGDLFQTDLSILICI